MWRNRSIQSLHLNNRPSHVHLQSLLFFNTIILPVSIFDDTTLKLRPLITRFTAITHHVSPSPVSTTLNHPPFTLQKLTTPTAISSCAARPPASPSADSATSATENAQSATPTCAPPPSCESATNAPSETTKTSAWSAVARESQTLSTASNARDSRRIGMGARRLLISVVRGRICSTRRRILGTIEGTGDQNESTRMKRGLDTGREPRLDTVHVCCLDRTPCDPAWTRLRPHS